MPDTSLLLSRFILAVLLLGSLVAPLGAQTPSPTESPEGEVPTHELRQRLEEVQRRLDEAQPSLRGRQPDGGVPSYADSLRRLDVNLRRLISLRETEARLRAEQEAVEQEFKRVAASGMEGEKPYSVELLDNLQAELDAVLEKAKGAELAHTAAETSLELAQESLQDRQATRRRLLDDLASTPDDLELRRRMENLEIAIEASQAAVNLAEAEDEVAEVELLLTRKRRELLETKLALVQESFKFSEDTLESQLLQLEESRDRLTRELSRLKEAEERSLEKLNQLLEDQISDLEQAAQIEARREWVLTHQRSNRLLEERLEFNLIRRDLWERRYLAHTRQTAADYDEWIDSARGLLVRLQKNRDVLNTELSQIRTELSELVNEDETVSEQERWREIEIQALVGRQKALEETLTFALETEHLAKRLLAELNIHLETAPVSERLGQAWRGLVNFWNIELYTLGDSAVTVGKLSVAIFVLVVGLAVTGTLTRFLSSKFLIRLPIKENIRGNLERLIRYLFVLLVFLFALHVVNIPLTIFTFLGGTLAIAIGFGAQNILNNFISGLILMVERPVRVGDLIEVDDTTGFVEEIGARSTRIRIPTGIHVILPNSTLLENKVINWTLQDQRLRVKVSVGVAYGSPTRRVVELIKQAVDEQEQVHRSPPPVVTFEDFGDSSLNFSVHFWVTALSPLDRDRASTEVRLRVDDLFREHGITIPFPQRDLNFNAPVPVRIIKETKVENE